MAYVVNLGHLRPQLIDELLEAAGVEPNEHPRPQLQLVAAARLVHGTVDAVEPEYHAELVLHHEQHSHAAFGPTRNSRAGAGPFARLPHADIAAWIERTLRDARTTTTTES